MLSTPPGSWGSLRIVVQIKAGIALGWSSEPLIVPTGYVATRRCGPQAALYRSRIPLGNVILALSGFVGNSLLKLVA
jgi:hypothetical protein